MRLLNNKTDTGFFNVQVVYTLNGLPGPLATSKKPLPPKQIERP
jgi:hypothetical protein